MKERNKSLNACRTKYYRYIHGGLGDVTALVLVLLPPRNRVGGTVLSWFVTAVVDDNDEEDDGSTTAGCCCALQ